MFFFNDTATTEIYTLSLHDALPISQSRAGLRAEIRYDLSGHCEEARPCALSLLPGRSRRRAVPQPARRAAPDGQRSEEHTSELQSRQYLVCRLLLEKKKHENVQ